MSYCGFNTSPDLNIAALSWPAAVLTHRQANLCVFYTNTKLTLKAEEENQ